MVGPGDDRSTLAVDGLDNCKPGAEVSWFTFLKGFRVVTIPFVVCANDGDADRLKEEVAVVDCVEKGLDLVADARKGLIAGAWILVLLLLFWKGFGGGLENGFPGGGVADLKATGQETCQHQVLGLRSSA